MSRSALAACRRAGSSKSTGRKARAKTTLALHVIAEAQKSGGVCAFVDAEHALDTIYAKKLGVDLDDLLVSQPDNGEQALEITDTLVRSGAIDVLVIDSVAAFDAARRTRRRNGRQPAGPASAPDEPGFAQADGLDQQIQDAGDLHQPDTHEDRRHVRQSGNDDGRQCAEILRFGTPRHSPYRPDQGTRRSDRFGNPREGGQEQGRRRRSSRFSSTSSTAKASPRPASWSNSASRAASSTRSGAWYAYGNTKIGQGKEAARRVPEREQGRRHRIEEKIRAASGLLADEMTASPEG